MRKILTVCIVIYFPNKVYGVVHYIYFKGSQIIMYVLQSLNIVFFLANSAGPDHIAFFVAFHLGLTVCQSTHLRVAIFALIITHVFVIFKHTLRTY